MDNCLQQKKGKSQEFSKHFLTNSAGGYPLMEQVLESSSLQAAQWLVRHQHRVPREAPDAPLLKMFKVRLGGTLKTWSNGRCPLALSSVKCTRPQPCSLSQGCSAGIETAQSGVAKAGGHSAVLLRPVHKAWSASVLWEITAHSAETSAILAAPIWFLKDLEAGKQDRAAVGWEKDLPNSAESSRTQPDLLSGNQNGTKNLQWK